MLDSLKLRLAGFLRWHVTNPIVGTQRELTFQNIFDNQCRAHGLVNDFYPVGAAANYGLMYLLFRVFDELEIKRVVEFGSGQTTLLIDRIKKDATSHVCYEHDPQWHALLAARLLRCDYRLRALEEATFGARRAYWYSGVELQNFDLLLVDGPIGVDRFSRFGCVDIIRSQTAADFLIVFDDCQRKGEQDTVAYVVDMLRDAGRTFRVNQLIASRTQTVIAGGRFVGATYYY